MARPDLSIDHYVVTGRPQLGQILKSAHISDREYDRRLKSLQGELILIQQAYLGLKERAIIVLEGWDTAGKGGIVRRLGWALDPRSFRVYPIAAPVGAEPREHYLQRFWRRLPECGQIVGFDRSWYGRVLVERVEKLATKPEWKRAYGEINDFERCLVEEGFRIVKIFLDITKDEQLKRFKERLTNPFKRWKLTYEDFLNHERWDDYERAIKDMMEETSTKHAPWYLIPSNDKHFSRIVAFEIFRERLGQGIDVAPRPLAADVAIEAERILHLKVSESVVVDEGKAAKKALAV